MSSDERVIISAESIAPLADDVANAVVRYLIITTDMCDWGEDMHNKLRGAIQASVIEGLRRHEQR